MKKILFFICLFFVSCATPKKVNPILKEKNAHLNKELICEIGQKMVDKSTLWEYKAIKVNNVPERITYYNRFLDIKNGDVLVLTSETSKYNLYYKLGTTDGMAISKENGEIVPFSTGSGSLSILKKANKEYQNISYSASEYTEIEKGSRTRQIFYNGKAGDILKFSYREFSEDKETIFNTTYTTTTARPAFTQDLQYDLSESNIIGFDGLRVEVIKATNTNITYKILSDFN